MNELFARAALYLSDYCGRPAFFVLIVVSTLLWCLWGWHFGFSDAMMAWMGAVTGIVSIAILNLLQHTSNKLNDAQRRDTAAIQIKLDELIRASADARNTLLHAEELDDHALQLERDLMNQLVEKAATAAE